jgi:LmbE family N-acetylglucosaminyl deacetylase
MNVLAVGCHPDDLEINAGGTLAKCAKRGDKVTMCVLGNGSAGHKVYSKEEIAAIRLQEATNSAAIIGAEYINLGVDDMFLRQNYDLLVKRLSDVIRKVRPDFIITHGPDEYMVDHSITNTITFDATMAATVDHYPTDHPEYPVFEKFTPIFQMENTSLVNSFPEIFVDISDTVDTKVEMFKQHKSQHDWLQAHDGKDVVEDMLACARLRGVQCNTRYVEGFTILKQSHHLPLKRYLPE